MDLYSHVFAWTCILAEATSWRAAIRTAQGVVQDIGLESASRSGGLTELSQCSQAHSESGGRKVVERLRLTIPIPLTTIPKTLGVRYTGEFQALKLEHWCQFLVDKNCWHMVCGLVRPDPERERAILTEFWTRFRALHPDHGLFATDRDWSRTVPLLLHGDEGRGRKKAPFLICSYHSVLGLGTEAANKARKTKPYLAMKLNYSGSSFEHRFPSTVLPKMVRDEVALRDLLEFMTRDALHLLEHGVRSKDGHTFYGACISIVGDWVWSVKAGDLQRSFHNVEKRARSEAANPRGICHLCQAGQLNVPFEDLRVNAERPWKNTMFAQNPFNGTPSLCRLPHVPHQLPRLFSFDLWHAWHLGVAKSFLAGCLALLSDNMDGGGGSAESRFQSLTQAYLQFCDGRGHMPFVSTISQLTIGWPDRATYPNGYWSKGHVSTLLSKFFNDYMSSNNVDVEQMYHSDLLKLCFDCNSCISSCLKSLYSSDVWIPVAEAKAIAMKGLKFLDGYHALAVMCYQRNMAMFPFMPKIHILDHIFTELYETACRRDLSFAANPLITAVQIDEDYIGKACRVSRRTGAAQVITRVLQRLLQASYKHWRKAGYIRS